MKLIDWYIFKKFIGTFFYAISLLIVIVIIFDISENIDDFLQNNAPVSEIIIDYYINFIPYFINLFVYLFTFISVIFFTSKMAGNSEIIAILSSGISFFRMLRPYLFASLLLGILSFYLGNFLIPKTNEIRRNFKDKYMEDLTKDNDRNIHIQIEKGVFVFVENYNNKQQTGYRFTIEHFNDEQMTYKLLADRIELDTSRGPNALRSHISKERLKGTIGVVNYEVEMQKRLASPAAILILTFIGAALSSRKVRGGIGMHLGIGIGITFSYILFMQFSTVFATIGNLPPILAAWIPNIFYTILGVYLMIKAPK
jgi:lipopolysaccharide export system permease protein